MTTPTRSPRRRWTSGGAGPVPVRCGAPTSNSGPELASPAPPSSSPVELLPPPPITGQAPPPPLAARESEEPRKRPVAGSKRHASQRRAHRRKRGWRENTEGRAATCTSEEAGVEREYGGKGAPTPTPFFPTVIVGAAGAATVPLHTHFSGSGLVSGSFWR
jgi:hypothetical protein